MIKFKYKELRFLRRVRPPSYWARPIPGIPPAENIKVRVRIKRGGDFPEILDLLLDQPEYDAFCRMRGTFQGTPPDSDTIYMFSFLPSDCVEVIQSNYAECCAVAIRRRDERRCMLEAQCERELREWQDEYDAIRKKPIFYWEKKAIGGKK